MRNGLMGSVLTLCLLLAAEAPAQITPMPGSAPPAPANADAGAPPASTSPPTLPPLPRAEEPQALPQPQLYEQPPPPPPPPQRVRRTQWGVQFRVEGVPMGRDAPSNARMGGLGGSVRPRIGPYFAFDVGLDFLWGHDFNGDERSETVFSVNPMVFVNPRHRVQLYLLGGFLVSSARVKYGYGGETRYRHIGVDGGAGLEFRFWRRFAIDADVLAFVRSRTDISPYPEYVDPATGRYTDTSAGAVLRLGLVHYW